MDLGIINEINGFIVTTTNHSTATRIETIYGFADSFQMSNQLEKEKFFI